MSPIMHSNTKIAGDKKSRKSVKGSGKSSPVAGAKKSRKSLRVPATSSLSLKPSSRKSVKSGEQSSPKTKISKMPKQKPVAMDNCYMPGWEIYDEENEAGDAEEADKPQTVEGVAVDNKWADNYPTDLDLRSVGDVLYLQSHKWAGEWVFNRSKVTKTAEQYISAEAKFTDHSSAAGGLPPKFTAKIDSSNPELIKLLFTIRADKKNIVYKVPKTFFPNWGYPIEK